MKASDVVTICTAVVALASAISAPLLEQVFPGRGNYIAAVLSLAGIVAGVIIRVLTNKTGAPSQAITSNVAVVPPETTVVTAATPIVANNVIAKAEESKMKINFIGILVQSLLQSVIAAIQSDLGQAPAAPPAPSAALPDVDALLAFKPTTQEEAAAHLVKLRDALAAVNPADSGTIGKIMVAIGGIILAFFPQYSQEAQFLISVGNALMSGGSGSVGPIRVAQLGLTVSWAPWTT